MNRLWERLHLAGWIPQAIWVSRQDSRPSGLVSSLSDTPMDEDVLERGFLHLELGWGHSLRQSGRRVDPGLEMLTVPLPLRQYTGLRSWHNATDVAGAQKLWQLQSAQIDTRGLEGPGRLEGTGQGV